MKKYLKLTSFEAIRHFILRDKTLVPEAPGELQHKLQDLDNLKSDLSISIVLPTHRTKPDYEIDVIMLKKLIADTEKELYSMLDKRKAEVFIENIREAQQTIDYSLSLDTMVVYANEYFASVLRLPVEMSESILIGPDFDLCPLYKTWEQNRRYYVLTISRNVIRLIEAFNDRVEQEIENKDFPFVNRDYYVDEAVELAQDSFIDNQIKEYFNLADKRFQEHYNKFPLPVILAGDVKMTAYYEEQMDNKQMIMAHVPGSYDKMTYPEIMKIVYPEVERYRESQQKKYMEEIDAAASAYLLSTDMEEMYKAIADGAGNTLYLGDSFSLNGTVEQKDDKYEVLVTKREDDVINRHDLLSGMIMKMRDSGGNVVFVEDQRMEKYEGAALVRRY